MADNLNFKQGEYRNATPGLFSKGDIVLGRVPQPIYSEMGFANKSGCMPRAEVLCLRTEDSYSPNGRISCLSPIMPGPGVGFLIGTGMKARPIYGMTSFNTKMSNDGLILNMALHAHDGVTDSADSSAFGTSFINFDIGLIPAASATQTGVVTITDQRFDGIKTFKSVHTDYGLVLTGEGVADNSTNWSSAINFKRKDNDKVIGSWMMYSTQSTVDNVNKISTAQPVFRCYNYEGKYIDIRMPSCAVGSLSASTNKYLAYINAETLPTKNMIPYFSAGGSNALLRTSSHYIDSTRLGINVTSIPSTDTTSKLYVSGSANITGGLSVNDLYSTTGIVAGEGSWSYFDLYSTVEIGPESYFTIGDLSTNYIGGFTTFGNDPDVEYVESYIPFYLYSSLSVDGATVLNDALTVSGQVTIENDLTIHSMNINSNSIYSTESETYSLGTETSFFSNEYVNTLNIGQAGNYIALKKVDENINTVSSIYLPNITEDSMLLYAKKDIQLGSPISPIYINDKGKAVVSNGTVGNKTTPMYLEGGVFTAMSESIGKINQPVYFDATNGFSPIECIAIPYGGTGLTSFEINKLYRYNGEKLIDTTHVIEEDKIYTDNQSAANYLGSCYGDNKWIYFSGNRSNGQRSLADSNYGDIINFTSNNIPKIHGIFCSHSTNYGTAEPTAASPVAEEGALYFKIIN